ncbi:cation-translocating P-type ATPase [Desulforhabdus sp. TSK]|uniref:heavy metal translocating P-type ATPase n=1 Tax=Desulforhabdus sp. TSK TaxID=2925014 RepID=UPI001FC7E5CE|nr:heavy metal translocating P-type ATPase [Desulforhabdus sp. TSK]GKT09761.1 cadmium transporter [Desulforhabdus sp. TSK]
MKALVFHIEGMDCINEVLVLKQVLGSLVGGELNLAFDALKGKMTVSLPDENTLTVEDIQKVVAKTGMRAVPWADPCVGGTCKTEEGLWQRRQRLLLCLTSGLLMAAGFVLHSFREGSLSRVMFEKDSGGHILPVEVIILYVGAIVTGGWLIFPKAFDAARRLRPDMNFLMTIAVIGAMWIGEWLEASAVAFLFSLALFLESWSVGQARQAISRLMDLSPLTARFFSPGDGVLQERPVEDVPVGATVLVRPGEKIPLDGRITKGETSINQAPITGESTPVFKKHDDEVFAGTINGDGAIEFRSTKAASDTTLARIIHMVEEAQSRRAPTEQWVEKFARIYTPAMMALAISIALAPPLIFGAGWEKWLYEGLVILVIACPCALAISTPVSIVAGLTSAARNGVLIKGGAYLEAPAHLKGIAFDKTGTLTRGEPSVERIVSLNGHTEAELLGYAAALEAHSTHPLAHAVLHRVEVQGISPPSAENFTSFPGLGAQATIENRSYWIGSHRMLEQAQEESPQLHGIATEMENAGHSLIFLWCEDHVCGLLGVGDKLRPEARESLRRLKELGLKKTVMLTGDNEQTARSVAESVGVDEYQAGLLPEDKVRSISRLKDELGQVAIVGDGVNDAPAMAEAGLGIAMGAIGSDAAIETADIALMSDDLAKIPWLIEHSRKVLRIIQQNIIFALGLKALFILLALSGKANLWSAIAADMGASLLVIFNALRLLHSKHDPKGPVENQGLSSRG